LFFSSVCKDTEKNYFLQIFSFFLYNKVFQGHFFLHFHFFSLTLGPRMKKHLSILIPVYNESCYDFVKKLKTMCAMTQETHHLEDYEIVVADDASTMKDCVSANRAINDMPHCRFIEKEQNTGSAATRNFLAQESRFEWLLFLDSDMVISHEDFLARYIECEAAGVINGGICIGEGPKGNLRHLYEKHCERQHTAQQRALRPYHSFRSTNFLIARDLMLRCPFDERFKKSGYEDVMLGRQFIEQSVDICHINNPLMMTSFEDNEAFMEKTERNLRTLYTFRKELAGFSQIADAHVCVRPFIRLWHRLFGGIERRNLCSSKPHLWVYQAYRLGYYLSLKDDSFGRMTFSS
jgi:glycosyltransferase involved in cell wall biosynthesis